jgi:hypothetical protein
MIGHSAEASFPSLKYLIDRPSIAFLFSLFPSSLPVHEWKSAKGCDRRSRVGHDLVTLIPTFSIDREGKFDRPL